MEVDETEVRHHLTTALSALTIFEERCKILDRENARWRSERELIAGFVKPEPGEDLYKACGRMKSDMIAATQRFEEMEQLLKYATRDAKEANDKLAGLMHKAEVDGSEK